MKIKNILFIMLLAFSLPGLAGDPTPIDINTATVEQLTSLDGIGEIKAKAIVAYRSRFGNFSSVDDLRLVSGIGEKTVDRNRAMMSVGDAETSRKFPISLTR